MLSDWTLVSTRPMVEGSGTKDSPDRLGLLLRSHGAVVIEVPLLVLKPTAELLRLSESVGALQPEDWLVFTSANGVRFAMAMLVEHPELKTDNLMFAAIGEKTALALKECGKAADFVSTTSKSRDFGAELAEYCKVKSIHPGVLLLRGEIASKELPDALRPCAREVLELSIYSSARRELIPLEKSLLLGGGSGEKRMVIFTSSESVRAFSALLQAAGDAGSKPGIAVLGPETARTAEELGLPPDVVASETTVEALVADVLGYVRAN